jgi:hypothetical protein
MVKLILKNKDFYISCTPRTPSTYELSSPIMVEYCDLLLSEEECEWIFRKHFRQQQLIILIIATPLFKNNLLRVTFNNQLLLYHCQFGRTGN